VQRSGDDPPARQAATTTVGELPGLEPCSEPTARARPRRSLPTLAWRWSSDDDDRTDGVLRQAAPTEQQAGEPTASAAAHDQDPASGTRVPFFKSRPGLPMLPIPTGAALVGPVLPYTGLAHLLGFTPRPTTFFLLLFAMVVIYLVLVEVAKTRFYRAPHAKHHDQPPSTPNGYNDASALAPRALSTSLPLAHVAPEFRVCRSTPRIPRRHNRAGHARTNKPSSDASTGEKSVSGTEKPTEGLAARARVAPPRRWCARQASGRRARPASLPLREISPAC
jgi:hypothetical protein